MLKNRKRKTNENGITMTALAITIFVIMLIAVPITVQISDPNKLNNLDKLKSDLVNLKESISISYDKSINFNTYDINSDNYIGPKAPSSLVEKLSGKEQEGIQVINSNDTQDNYYIIDFTKLNSILSSKYNMSLDKTYYGKENLDITGKSEEDLEKISDDVYIINNKSRTIYYVKGIEYEGTTYYRYQEKYSELDEILPGSTLYRSQAPTIKVEGLKYADIDGDKVADGIIVADISKDSTDTNTYKGGNPWSDYRGSFSYIKQETGLKEYKEEPYTYTGGNSNVSGTLVTCTNDSGNPRYFILSLGNYDLSTHYWYNSASGKLDNYHSESYNDFGEGKKFTDYYIEKWNTLAYGTQNGGSSATDMWGIIQYKAKEGWFVPSRAEWAAFGSYLNTSNARTDTNYYENYGLSRFYLSSAQYTKDNIYMAVFNGTRIGYDKANAIGYYVRLASTF